MPVYLYHCEKCGHEEDGFNRVDDRRTNAPECHGKMGIKLTPANVMADIEAYVVPGTDKIISSRSSHRNYLRENNLVEVGNECKPPEIEE